MTQTHTGIGSYPAPPDVGGGEVLVVHGRHALASLADASTCKAGRHLWDRIQDEHGFPMNRSSDILLALRIPAFFNCSRIYKSWLLEAICRNWLRTQITGKHLLRELEIDILGFSWERRHTMRNSWVLSACCNRSVLCKGGQRISNNHGQHTVKSSA